MENFYADFDTHFDRIRTTNSDGEFIMCLIIKH